ncbi:hypothetical protein CPB85DRAFT_553919 [Mucidula mucida]|nr:hypothetical protein CPB85DRAFT_553919 [Mucidula mucida]
MAFSTNCAFLLHSVLAFSALHLHHLHQAHPNASKYFYAAASHYNQALKTIPAYPDSSSDDNHILYPTHTLISMYGFATSECVYAQSDWIDMVRTTPTSRYDGYRTSPLAPLMRALATTYTAISAQLQIDLTGPSLFPPSLSYLHLPTPGAPNADEVRDPVIADTYQKAIFHLRRTWVASLHPEFRCYAAFIFLVSAPDLFFTLLWEQRPRALIIAGHYCAILRRMKGQWWTKRDWSAQIERIMAAVGDQWRAWFDWVSEVEQVRTFETYQDNSALYTWMPS